MSPGMHNGSRWVGRVLRDKWRIDARLARGGVGTVFAATHRNNGSRVAIKVLHPEFSRDRDTRSRFLQEGYAANQVAHPGVVRILDDDVAEDGAAFLVMELLEGELLEKRRTRKGGKLTMAEVYEVADQLLDVLVAAHEKGIVHRDIKPENLFLTKEGRLKVLDFGFAQMKSGFRKEQTATGFLLGTPGFMSPEQAIGARAEIDAKTDIWAVGATLFCLLSGEPVHQAESIAEMLVAAANYPARSLAAVAPEVPLRLVEVVDRALAFDKADRWQSARSMQNALRSVPRQAVGGTWNPVRHSIPDYDPDDDRTLHEGQMQIDVLDGVELIDDKPSDRTMESAHRIDPGGSSPPPRASSPPSDITVPPITPVMADGPSGTRTRAPAMQGTVPLAPPMSATPDVAQKAPFAAPLAAPMPPPESNPAADGGTLIMEGASALKSGPYDAQGGPSTQPLGARSLASTGSGPTAGAATSGGTGGGPGPDLGTASLAPPLAVSSRANRSEEMMYVAGPARPASATSEVGSTRRNILTFVAVAVISMIIVVVTGLLVLAASD